MPLDATSLKAECQNNPNGYSFTDTTVTPNVTKTLAQWFADGNDSVCAAILNTVRDGSNGAAITVPKSGVSGQEVEEAIDLTDMTTASALNTQLAALVPPKGPVESGWVSSWFESMIQNSSIQLRKWNAAHTAVIDARVLANIKLLLVNGSASESRLRTLGQRNGSRAEQLAAPLLDVRLQPSDIQAARNLP